MGVLPPNGDVQRRVDGKLDRFADSMGREPTSGERWQPEREAVVDSRPAKPEALDAGLFLWQPLGWLEATLRQAVQADGRAEARSRRTVGTRGYSSLWLTMLITFPSGARTKNLRMPHDSSVSGWTIS